ncbi:phytoene/squalene synthase family protein [Cryomorphaceae bacterium]|nr:phytoene/squalene synthase family protein [Cryomorphaceae bacterium]
MKALYDQVSLRCSKIVTRSYSTSFSMGIRLLSSELHDPIYAVYGFVRFADEIVDSFHDFDKKELLDRFRLETYQALEERISLNPILNSFQEVVHRYSIERELIDAFLHSMEMDLEDREYDQSSFEEYILGSAEVVGLMCLRVFLNGDEAEYQRLKAPAMKLGSAFQKVNFLRDLKADYEKLGRSYFPDVNLEMFDQMSKQEIEADIEADFKEALEGIKELPRKARFGVYLAYMYYTRLFEKIRNTEPMVIMQERVRIPNTKKYGLMVGTYFRYRMNLL